MLKPSFKSSEGIAFIFVIANVFGIIWYLITRQPPPLPDYEALLGYAKTADQVSDILKMVANVSESESIDWDKLGVTGGLSGVLMYIFQYFTRVRSELKKEELVLSASKGSADETKGILGS